MIAGRRASRYYTQLLLQDKRGAVWYTVDNGVRGESALTVYDVLNWIDKDLSSCDDAIKRSRRAKTMVSLVKLTERKKILQEIKDYILTNH